MLSLEVFPRETRRADGCKTVNDVTAVIKLTFCSTGSLVLGFPRDMAQALAQRLLVDSGAEVDDALIRDCVGEIANVVAGQAKAVLHGTPYRFTHSTPTIFLGPDRTISDE